MVHELEHHVETQGMEFPTYLKNINKSLPELKLDFAAPALQRIKVSLIIKEIQKKESVTVPEADVDTELDQIASQFKPEDESRKRIYGPEYREYVLQQLTNRATINKLKDMIVK